MKYDKILTVLKRFKFEEKMKIACYWSRESMTLDGVDSESITKGKPLTSVEQYCFTSTDMCHILDDVSTRKDIPYDWLCGDTNPTATYEPYIQFQDYLLKEIERTLNSL